MKASSKRRASAAAAAGAAEGGGHPPPPPPPNTQEGGTEDDGGDEAYFDLIRADPTISERTKAQYVMNLGTLVRETGGRGLPWVLLHAEETMEALLERFRRREASTPPSPQSLLAYCAAATALVKRLPEERRAALGGAALLRRYWDSCTADLTARVRAKYDSWIASDRQRDNYVSWEGLVARREQLASDPRTYGSNAHLLLAFLTYMPPMRTSNYGQMRLFDERGDGRGGGGGGGDSGSHGPPRRRLPPHRHHQRHRAEMEAQRWNYVRLQRRRGIVVVQDFKTANHYRRLASAASAAGNSSSSSSSSGNSYSDDDRSSNGCYDKEDVRLMNVGHDGNNDSIPANNNDESYENGAIRRKLDALYAQFSSSSSPLTSSTSVQKRQPQNNRRQQRGVVVDRPFSAGPVVVPAGVYDDRAPVRSGEMPPQLYDLLCRSADARPRAWVFVNKDGQPFTRNAFLRHVSSLLKRTFDGKAMSVDLVRHAATNWLDAHYRHDPVVLTYFRYWMMHSRDMQGEYVLAHNLSPPQQQQQQRQQQQQQQKQQKQQGGRREEDG